jgi:hydrogenase maturation protein HypF
VGRHRRGSWLREACVDIRPAERAALLDPARPIVLARHRAASPGVGIAPGLAEVGVFLPYSPLHQLLLDAMGSPVVATSGNVSGEPVLTDPQEASAAGPGRRRVPASRPADRPPGRRLRVARRSPAGRDRAQGRGVAPLELELPRPCRGRCWPSGATSR